MCATLLLRPALGLCLCCVSGFGLQVRLCVAGKPCERLTLIRAHLSCVMRSECLCGCSLDGCQDGLCKVRTSREGRAQDLGADYAVPLKMRQFWSLVGGWRNWQRSDHWLVDGANLFAHCLLLAPDAQGCCACVLSEIGGMDVEPFTIVCASPEVHLRAKHLLKSRGLQRYPSFGWTLPMLAIEFPQISGRLDALLLTA